MFPYTLGFWPNLEYFSMLLNCCMVVTLTSVSSQCLDAFDQWCLHCILRIPYIVHVNNDEVWRRTNHQSLLLWRQNDCICLATLPVPTCLSTTHMLSGQPSNVLKLSGVAELVDLGELDFTNSNWMSASSTSASILCGSVCKMAKNGDSYPLWRACHLMMMMTTLAYLKIIVGNTGSHNVCE